MNSRRMTLAAVSLALVTLLAACGESRSVASHQPDAYERAKDPLLDLHATPEHKAALKERFNKGVER